MTESAGTPELDALALLDDYVSGHMPDGDADAYEEALFARAATGAADEAAFNERLRGAVTWITRRGSFNVGSTRAEVEFLRASGIPLSYMEFGNGGIVSVPPFPPGIELFVYRLGVDLRGYDAVDVVVETPAGEPVKTFRDVRYDPEDGSIFGVCEVPLAEISFRRGVVISKVMAGHGAERQLVATFETRPQAR